MNVRQLEREHQSPVTEEFVSKGVAVWQNLGAHPLSSSPSGPPMLRSLILPAVFLASQAMALNFTYAYVPGFFAQDDPNADSNLIGAVSETWLANCARGWS